MIAHKFLIQNLIITFTGKKLVLRLFSIPLPTDFFFFYFFCSLSPLLSHQIQSIDGLNHTAFPVVFTVFFTAEQLISIPFQSTGNLRDHISLTFTGEFTPVHL